MTSFESLAASTKVVPNFQISFGDEFQIPNIPIPSGAMSLRGALAPWQSPAWLAASPGRRSPRRCAPRDDMPFFSFLPLYIVWFLEFGAWILFVCKRPLIKL
jgi:hypothetical protein